MNNKTIKIKQTATEWLIEKLEINNSLSRAGEYWDLIKNEAKAIEKEQIKDAFEDGCIGEMYELNAQYTAEKYYNKRYDKGEQKR